MLGLMVCLAIVSQPNESAVDGAQFSNIVRALHSKYRDVTLIFEGSLFKTDDEDRKAFYQGVYSFRLDGASLLDKYTRPENLNRPYSRQIYAILNQSLTRMLQVPDQGFSDKRSTGGGPGSLNMPGSYERALYSWYLTSLDDPDAYGYEYQGWEDVDGHRCLRVQLSRLLKTSWKDWPGGIPYISLWVDLNRGGHPLKVEFLKGSNVSMRTEGVKLAEIDPGTGIPAWFPVKAVTSSFSRPKPTGGSIYESSPVYVEDYMLVAGSVQVNQGLKDEYFTVDRKKVDFHNASLNEKKLELDRASKLPVFRIDSAGVKARLADLLKEADAQAEELQAQSPTRVFWNTTTVLQLVLSSSSLLLLLVVLYLKWGRR